MTTPQGMLAPCPFCGSPAMTSGNPTDKHEPSINIHCSECSAEGGFFGGANCCEIAIRHWNSRQAAQGREATIEKLAENFAESLFAQSKIDLTWPEMDNDGRDAYRKAAEFALSALALTPAVAPDAGAGEDAGYDHEPTGHMYECPGCGIDIANPNEQHKPDCPRAVPPPPRAFEPMREQIAQLICCTKVGCIFKDTEQGCIALDPEHPGSLETADAIIALSGGRGA